MLIFSGCSGSKQKKKVDPKVDAGGTTTGGTTTGGTRTSTPDTGSTTSSTTTGAATDGGIPTVLSVTSSKANGSYKVGAEVAVTIIFSEVVTVTGTPQLTLETGSTDAVINYLSGTGTAALTFKYIIASDDTSADLDYVATTSLALNLGAIIDSDLIPATLTLPSPGGANSLGNSKALVIDTTAPTITYTSISPTSPGASQTPAVTLSLSEASGTSGLGLYSESGCTTSIATAVTGTSGSNVVTTTTLASASTTAIYAKATDVAGNESSCTSMLSYTHSAGGGAVTGTVATPTFSVAAGTYSSTQSVTLSSSTSGSTIYYTIDGSTPTSSSSVYASPISVSASQTIKALATKSTWTDSSVASAAYVYDGVAPTAALSAVQTSANNASTINMTAQFSETVTGFDLTDITVANGTKGNFVAIDGDTYTFDITAPSGTVTVNIAGAVAQDAATNGNTAATEFSIIYDNTAPLTPQLDISSKVFNGSFNVTASQNASTDTNFLGFRYTKTGTAPANCSSGTATSGIIAITETANVTLKVIACDTAGNQSSAVTGTYTYDVTAPPQLDSISGTTGVISYAVDVSLNLPADVSDYFNLKVYRSAPSATVGVAAPSCGSGTLVKELTSFAVDPYTFTDDTGQSNQYFSYRACITDFVGNMRNSNTIVDARSKEFAHVMFVTSANYNGNLKADFDNKSFASGAEGADYRCQWHASQAGRSGAWKAFISTNEEGAKARIPIFGTIYRTDSVVIATDVNDMWDETIANPIIKDETGTTKSSSVWTGTWTDGLRPSENCNSWTSASSSFLAYYGRSDQSNIHWITNPRDSNESYRDYCATSNPIYCISAVEFPDLAGFVAQGASATNGSINISLTLPSDVSAYDHIDIRRATGITAPSGNCNDGTLVTSFTSGSISSNAAISYSNSGLSPGAIYSYRACAYDSQGRRIATKKAEAVHSAGTFHRMFLTSTSYAANLDSVFDGHSFASGLQGADYRCQWHATRASLSGAWQALLSSSAIDAKDKLGISGAVYLLDNTLVATGSADMWDGSLAVASSKDETGATFTGHVRTGTNSDGTKANNCSSWTSTSGTFMVGYSTYSNTAWSSTYGYDSCVTPRPHYCISSEYAYDPNAIPPAPTNLGLASGDSEEGTVSMTWNVVFEASRYNIYWSTTSPVTTSSNKIVVSAPNYVHTGRAMGSTYYYRVSGENSTGEGALSSENSVYVDKVLIIDNGDAGFSAPDYTVNVGEGFQNDTAYAATGNGSSVATWTFNGLATGTYRVSATWSTHSNRARNSPFTVYDGATSLGTIPVDQEQLTTNRRNVGANWQDLGSSFEITGSTLVVKLTNAANEFVIADGIRIERLSPLLAAGGAIAGSSAVALTNLGLQPIVAAAIARLGHEGFDPQVLSRVVFTIEDLPGATLGVAGSQAISIDVNAAGHGWFVDATPLDDREFSGGALPLTTMDLLSVVMHELGHTAGRADLYDPDHADDLMAGFLRAGTRHDAGSEHAGSEHTITATINTFKPDH